MRPIELHGLIPDMPLCIDGTGKHGEWVAEPDRKLWLDEGSGMMCLIDRNGHGALCGYVGVSRKHPRYELSVDQMYDHQYAEGDQLNPHGGLNFAGTRDQYENDLWWFGFSCHHLGDLAPKTWSVYKKLGLSEGLTDSFFGEYRNLAYVERECRCLARRLNRIGRPLRYEEP